MTTARSPGRVLRAQAEKIAAQIKAMENGEPPPVPDPAGKIAASHGTGLFSFGVIMDDKTLKFAMPWTAIRSMSVEMLAKTIFRAMREERRRKPH